MQPEIERCRREIASIEAQLRSGHPDLLGLIRALMASRKRPRLNRGRRTVSRDSGPKRAKSPRKPVEDPTFVAFQAQNRALLKRFSEVIEGRVI